MWCHLFLGLEGMAEGVCVRGGVGGVGVYPFAYITAPPPLPARPVPGSGTDPAPAPRLAVPARPDPAVPGPPPVPVPSLSPSHPLPPQELPLPFIFVHSQLQHRWDLGSLTTNSPPTTTIPLPSPISRSHPAPYPRVLGALGVLGAGLRSSMLISLVMEASGSTHMVPHPNPRHPLGQSHEQHMEGGGHSQDTHISGWGGCQKLQAAGMEPGVLGPVIYPPPPQFEESIIAQCRAGSSSASAQPRPPALGRWR